MWIWLYEHEEKYWNKHTDPTLLNVGTGEEEATQKIKNRKDWSYKKNSIYA